MATPPIIHPTSPYFGAIKLTVNLTIVQITSGAIIPSHEITVKADNSNGGGIYIGGPNVGVAQNGFKLLAGEGISGIKLDEVGRMYAIADAITQVLWIFYLGPEPT